MGSPAFAALLGPMIFLGMSGLLSLSYARTLGPQQAKQVFDLGTLVSPFVALVFVLLGMIVWRIRRPRTLLET